ncbi:MAG: sigma 54-interacting transcriptional regulator [Desulfobacteraceae bacterium]|nr:sigma 54-interacting transcriptional regulator [Desulfobacteraceae bacterium]MDH3837822.1 sigma 54-interacting transcriptional regulator [Desulfobacteraceae bacterium]MDH3874881.1 sigma 54-interacting transcriptional regulator [Desulfobacteraceae bacterium]
MIQDIKNQTKIILDSIADGVFTVDSDWKITSFNRAAEKITGIKNEEAVGRYCWEVFKASICEKGCSLRRTMETGRPIINQHIFIVDSKGDRIPISISTAILKDKNDNVIGGAETFRDLSVVEQLRKELAKQHTFYDIISKNREMQRLFEMLELVSKNDTTVLLEGESGTGKELFARAIHSLSQRKKGPIITVNCGALPDTLLESELFGYKAGAFTDAKRDKPGRFAQAKNGTLFLDEIGDISPMLQMRLLRVLQEKVYEPLGSTKSETADVRIVAATNKNLEALVQQGLFRDDLYYRINIVTLFLPPLRARKDDIPLLVEHFLRRFNSLRGKEIQGLSPKAMNILMSYDFPGNIRELENIVEYATVVCKNHWVGKEHLPETLYQKIDLRKIATPEATPESDPSLKAVEKDMIYKMLKKNNWNRKLTAAQMGIHPSTLWRKMKRLNIIAPKQDGRSRTRAF